MAKLKINAPDGKTLSINVPEGTNPASYDELVQNVVSDYMANKPESNEPGVMKSAALGLMSGLPGAETVVSGIQAIDPKVDYKDAHAKLEADKDAAWENHPVAYGAGKTAGFAGTALTLPATGTLGGAAALGAGLGAASGVDAAADTNEMLKSGAEGAAVGGALGGLGHAASSAIENILPAIGKRAVASLGKPALEDVESYLQNPNAIREALTTPQMSEKLADTVGDVGRAAGHMTDAAKSTLNPESSPLSILDIRPVFEGATQKYLTSGVPATASDELAVKAINGQYERLVQIAKNNNGQVPEDVLQEIIHKIQSTVNDNTWGNPDAKASQDALRGLSGKLNEILKTSNPEFREAMKPAAELAGLKSDVAGKFGLDVGTGGKVSSTDATGTKINNVLNETKTESQDLLEQLKQKTGIDFLDLARKAKTRDAFEGGSNGGAGVQALAHTAGYAAGAATGLPGGRLIGSLVGGVVGHNVDGGMLAKGILDAYISKSDAYASSAMKPLLDKFGPVLVNAAKVGGNQLAATHFVLSTSNPEYQQLVDGMQNNSDSGANTGIVNQE